MKLLKWFSLDDTRTVQGFFISASKTVFVSFTILHASYAVQIITVRLSITMSVTALPSAHHIKDMKAWLVASALLFTMPVSLINFHDI